MSTASQKSKTRTRLSSCHVIRHELQHVSINVLKCKATNDLCQTCGFKKNLTLTILNCKSLEKHKSQPVLLTVFRFSITFHAALPPDWRFKKKRREKRKADGFKHSISPHGSLTRRSRTPQVCLNSMIGCVDKLTNYIYTFSGINIFIHALMHRVAQSECKKKKRERECWGSEGQRVGEGEKGEGRGADTRRADFSQISLHLCDKKGNNSFRWGNLQRDTFHLPLHCVRQITGNTEEKEREASLARMWADVLKCTQHSLFQMYKIRLNINTFRLEEKKLKFIPTLV